MFALVCRLYGLHMQATKGDNTTERPTVSAAPSMSLLILVPIYDSECLHQRWLNAGRRAYGRSECAVKISIHPASCDVGGPCAYACSGLSVVGLTLRDVLAGMHGRLSRGWQLTRLACAL
jgi:hypothetical protein